MGALDTTDRYEHGLAEDVHRGPDARLRYTRLSAVVRPHTLRMRHITAVLKAGQTVDATAEGTNVSREFRMKRRVTKPMSEDHPL